ncbi:hypothetical protein SELMODRAFT_415644 [Selaginella moellendorffii]|uniref:Protein kinase domain-containing protein n=1 Tax=Selaginella moellendorffii TaxID=88036 RepID=D8RWS8_SELML|nr:hypothetical protein SELMODRAFT_415644 [Selaginella moellendorffii]
MASFSASNAGSVRLASPGRSPVSCFWLQCRVANLHPDLYCVVQLFFGSFADWQSDILGGIMRADGNISQISSVAIRNSDYFPRAIRRSRNYEATMSIHRLLSVDLLTWTLSRPQQLIMIERAMRTIRRELNSQVAHAFSTCDGYSLDVFVVDGWSCEDTEGLQSALERLRHHKEAWIKPNLHSNGLRKQGHLKIPFDGKDDWEIDSDQLRLPHKGIICKLVSRYILWARCRHKGLKAGTPCKKSLRRKFSAYGIIYCFNATEFVHSYSLTECLSGGSLYDYLHKHRSALKLPLVLRLGIDVSKGMDYRHQNNILHRDFKAANLRMRTRLLDFGVVRIMTAETETYRWMTPEVIEHKLYDQKADIFSPGIVLCPCLTQLPYDYLAVAVVQKYWKDAGKKILMSDQNFVTANDRLQGNMCSFSRICYGGSFNVWYLRKMVGSNKSQENEERNVRGRKNFQTHASMVPYHISHGWTEAEDKLA